MRALRHAPAALGAWVAAALATGCGPPEPTRGVPAPPPAPRPPVAGEPVPVGPWALDCTRAGPVDWELVLRETIAVPYPVAFAAGHREDTNHDGILDGRDGMALPMAAFYWTAWVQYRREGPVLTFAEEHDDPIMVGHVAVADLEQDGGIEAVVTRNVFQRDNTLETLGPDGGELLLELDKDTEVVNTLDLADMDGDGDLDAYLGLYDGTMWVDLDTLERHTVSRYRRGLRVGAPALADLDLDGDLEVLGADGPPTPVPPDAGGDLGVVAEDGTVPNPCLSLTDWTFAAFAVGNLDGDDEGEFAILVDGGLALCDTTGDLLAYTSTDLIAYTLALGDLSGDGRPELVAVGDRIDDSLAEVQAYDLDLNLLWNVELAPQDAPPPIALADLDADGDHEVIYAHIYGVNIVGGDGEMLSTWYNDLNSSNLFALPMVVDVDGDGLAEIVVSRWNKVDIMTTPTGGFPAAGASHGWTGRGHYPWKLHLDGTLDRDRTPWLLPGGNGWNAQPLCVPP